MKNSDGNNRPFFIVALQIENIAAFKKMRPTHVVNGLFREIYQGVRQALHPSQYVGMFENGLALVFDGVDVGHADEICQKLVTLTQQVIRAGHYNDFTSRWTDILYQFLSPSSPGVLFTRVGWAIYPRDGATPLEIINRALHHSAELNR
jgi:hypothetical protein